MTHRILIIGYRKPGLTPDEFKTYYEETHVPLVKRIAGPLFPLSHTRRYLRRTVSNETATESRNGNANYPAVVLSGSQADFEYDAVAELKFKDQVAFGAFFAILNEPDNSAKIAADCENFMDQGKTALVEIGDYVETTADT